MLLILGRISPAIPICSKAISTAPRSITSYVRKPIYSREGANSTAVDSISVANTPGLFGGEGLVFQKRARFCHLHGKRGLIGSWYITDQGPPRIGVRESDGLITRQSCRIRAAFSGARDTEANCQRKNKRQESMAQQKPDDSTLEKYRAAKETIRELEKAARQELIEKYHALMGEATGIQKELKEVFNYRIRPTSLKSRKPRSKPLATRQQPKPDNSKQIGRLKKRIETARQNLARAADPKAGRVFQDRIVELEDELRLLTTND